VPVLARLSARVTPSFTLGRVEPICPTSYPLLTLICLWRGRLILSWRMPTRMLQRMPAGIFARVSREASRISGHREGGSSTGIAVAGARMPHAADAVTHRGRTMSRSNPMHHGPREPIRGPVWPFPITLPAPGHAPDPKPVRAPVAPRQPLPDTPALF
jgi:hypothetical protein